MERPMLSFLLPLLRSLLRNGSPRRGGAERKGIADPNGNEEMERSAPVQELTSGASGRIVPVFRNISRSVPSPRSLLRIFVFFHAIFLWFLLALRRSGRSPVCSKAAASSPLASPRRRGGGGGTKKGWRAAKDDEEEDVRRRRALAEGVAMVDPSDGGDDGCRWETFVLLGSRRNALFCRSWVPPAGRMR